MTGLFIPNSGRQPPKLVPLTVDTPVTLLAGDNKSIPTIESIAYSCKGSTTNLSIWLTDGTTIAELMSEEVVTQNTHFVISDWHPTLASDKWLLRAQASAADMIDIIVVFAKSTQTDTRQ